jgi:glycerol uptake facilitator-like aquaporin
VADLIGGAVFNPAVAFSLHMNGLWTIQDPDILYSVTTYASLFYVATFLGGFIAALFTFWHELNLKEIEDDRNALIE